MFLPIQSRSTEIVSRESLEDAKCKIEALERKIVSLRAALVWNFDNVSLLIDTFVRDRKRGRREGCNLCFEYVGDTCFCSTKS